MIPYERYRADLVKLGATDIPTEQEYNRSYGITTEPRCSIMIRPRNQRHSIIPTLQHHEKTKVSKNTPKASKRTDYLDELEKVERSHFVSTEHYFDFIEAKQILKDIRGESA